MLIPVAAADEPAATTTWALLARRQLLEEATVEVARIP